MEGEEQHPAGSIIQDGGEGIEYYCHCLGHTHSGVAWNQDISSISKSSSCVCDGVEEGVCMCECVCVCVCVCACVCVCVDM